MGRSQREKGKVGERQTASDLRATFPELALTIRRGWQARDGADDADVTGLPGFWFESKKVARFNTSPLDQAITAMRSRGKLDIPVAVIRPDRKEAVAMLPWADLLKLLRAYVGPDTPYIRQYDGKP